MKYLKTFEESDYKDLLYYIENRPNIEKVKEKIEAGDDVNATNKFGETPLTIVSATNKIDVVKILIEAGADLNIRDNSKYAALHAAVNHNNYIISKMLIEAGADVNIQDNDDDTPLFYAAYKTNIMLIKLLTDAGADWFIKNKFDNYFIDYIIESGKDTELINLYPDKYKEYLMIKNAEKYNI